MPTMKELLDDESAERPVVLEPGQAESIEWSE